MLQPSKTKYKHVQKGRNRGIASRGIKVPYGDFGIKALENGFINAKQIEMLRVLISKAIDKKFGSISINCFPTKPVTKKALGARMGCGKGNFEYFEAPVKAGEVIFIVHGINEQKIIEIAKEANSKLPFKVKAAKPKILLY